MTPKLQIAYTGERVNLFYDKEAHSILGDRVALSRIDGALVVLPSETGRKSQMVKGTDWLFVAIPFVLGEEPFKRTDVTNVSPSQDGSGIIFSLPERRVPESGKRSSDLAELVARLNKLIDDDTMTLSVEDNRLEIEVREVRKLR